MGYDCVILSPTITFDIQPIDSSSESIVVDLSAAPISVDFSKGTPWAIASAIVIDITTSTTLYNQVGGVNDTGGPGGGINACHLVNDRGDIPVLFQLKFNSPPWNGSDSPTPVFSVALVLQYAGYVSPTLPPNS